MRFIIKLAIEDETSTETVEEIIHFNNDIDGQSMIGLSLSESKQILKGLQSKIISSQAIKYIKSKRKCAHCHKNQTIKEHHSIQYRTLFGIVNLASPRLFRCQCHGPEIKTFSPLSEWLVDKNSPELQYIETKWASLISFEQTANLLKDVLPVGETENAATIRNHLHVIAKKQEKELEGKLEYISGCQNEWDKLPKPGKPITVGIDGGHLKYLKNKSHDFEVIAGKTFSATKLPKRFDLIKNVMAIQKEG